MMCRVRRAWAGLALGAALAASGCALDPGQTLSAVTGAAAGAAPPGSSSAASVALPEPATPAGPNAAAVARVADVADAQRHLAVTAHPAATEAALAMLRRGGSALDAAIAAQMVLSVVEPQSSGLGGGALLLHFDGHRVSAWDGRETAPAKADERLFIGPDGQPMEFMQAVVGGRTVGVPGMLRMLEAAHRAHGRLPWAVLFEPAIAAAGEGFAIGPRLHALLAADPALRSDALARRLYYAADGTAHPVAHRLRNPALARVLARLAAEGASVLHTGAVADDTAARVRGHAANPGRLDTADLAAYRPVEREPLCTLWRARWRVCGFPPPSSGHLMAMQMLGMLEHLPGAGSPLDARTGRPGADWLHAYIEAARLAAADRAVHVADPAFAAAPGGDWARLLEPAYLRRRAALIGPARAPSAPAGHPAGEPVAAGAMAERAATGTTHLSIVDAQGRAVALTSSVESAFGARLMTDGGTGLPGGWLLNNQLTDFSFEPADAQGRPVANRVEGGKRPRSSMAPTLVFDTHDDGRLAMVLGSPLGPAIPHLVARTLAGVLHAGAGPQAVVQAANFAHFGGPLVVEPGGIDAITAQALADRGHAVIERDLPSGLAVIVRTATGWRGVADPRREGTARGD